jgi:hypothetical protein
VSVPPQNSILKKRRNPVSEKNDKPTMDPEVFEAFVTELASQMKKFDVSKKQTVDFFNEAIRTVKNNFANAEGIEELSDPVDDDRPWIIKKDEV